MADLTQQEIKELEVVKREKPRKTTKIFRAIDPKGMRWAIIIIIGFVYLSSIGWITRLDAIWYSLFLLALLFFQGAQELDETVLSEEQCKAILRDHVINQQKETRVPRGDIVIERFKLDILGDTFDDLTFSSFKFGVTIWDMDNYEENTYIGRVVPNGILKGKVIQFQDSEAGFDGQGTPLVRTKYIHIGDMAWERMRSGDRRF